MKRLIVCILISFFFPYGISGQHELLEQNSVVTILLSAVRDAKADDISNKILKAWKHYANENSIKNIKLETKVDGDHIYVLMGAESPDLLLLHVKNFNIKLQKIVSEKGVVWLEGPWLTLTSRINLQKLLSDESEGILIE